MISAGSRPRLAAKARLRFDRRTERLLLLYPERGLELNATAAEVVKLCTGAHTVRAIVDRQTAAHDGAARDVVEREVLALLRRLARRGLLGEQA